MVSKVEDAPTALPAQPARRQARRGTILLTIAGWNVWLWVTRIYNLASDDTERTAAFIGVHALLYGVSLALAGVLAVMGVRMRREARAARDEVTAT